MEKAGSSNVSGKWCNELGSVMDLKEDENGQVSGTYTTAAEFFKSNSPQERANIVGYTNTQKSNGTTTITFCMAWKTEGSCSGFTGQIFKDKKDHDVMKTTWLLHSPVDHLEKNWETTCVGENTFHRCQ